MALPFCYVVIIAMSDNTLSHNCVIFERFIPQFHENELFIIRRIYTALSPVIACCIFTIKRKYMQPFYSSVYVIIFSRRLKYLDKRKADCNLVVVLTFYPFCANSRRPWEVHGIFLTQVAMASRTAWAMCDIKQPACSPVPWQLALENHMDYFFHYRLHFVICRTARLWVGVYRIVYQHCVDTQQFC